MKKTIVVSLVILILAGIGYMSAAKYLKQYRHMESHAQQAQKDIYYCPMHPSYTSDKPGDCPICGMRLVKKEKDVRSLAPNKKERKILHYRNPMNPQVTSPVPMKDSMGMDYVPVYEEAGSAQGTPTGIYMSAEKQQLIGVKKEPVAKRRLTYEILTVGRVAYDPGLYVAQQEYLTALKTKDSLQGSALPLVKEQALSLVDAAVNKLLLMGMNKAQIDELAKQAKPQQNLYLTGESDTVWVYAPIHEYELSLVKEGLDVDIDSVAFPAEILKGKIAALRPVLDPVSRSLEVRIEVANPEHKLKPDMYVNAKIKIGLGEKLSVPDSAVLDTGIRKIVYVAKEGGYLEQREVTVGQRSEGYYEVLSGLKEGEEVVTSGNFLVDSESKLR